MLASSALRRNDQRNETQIHKQTQREADSEKVKPGGGSIERAGTTQHTPKQKKKKKQTFSALHGQREWGWETEEEGVEVDVMVMVVAQQRGEEARNNNNKDTRRIEQHTLAQTDRQSLLTFTLAFYWVCSFGTEVEAGVYLLSAPDELLLFLFSLSFRLQSLPFFLRANKALPDALTSH